MSREALEAAAARKRAAAGRTRCDGCGKLLTGQQVRWCSAECNNAYQRAHSSGVRGQPRRHHVAQGDVFGKGTVVAEIRIDSTRAALLTCSCGPSLYAARLTDLVQGKVRSCGHRSFEKKLEAADRALRKAGQRAERAARLALDGTDYEVVSVSVRRRGCR